MNELDRHVNHLHFPPEMEKSFHADYYHKSIAVTRLALVLAIGLVAMFSLLDLMAAPAAAHLIWRIRFWVICPVFGLILLLTYRPIFMRWMQPLIAVAVLTGGLGIAALSAVTMPSEPAYASYYAGLLLVIMWGYTFIRLRFWYATVVGLLVVAGYEIAAIVFQHLLTAPMGYVIFINNNFFLLTANLIGIFAGYFIERYARLDFLQRQVIETEKRKVEAAFAEQARLAKILEATTDMVAFASLDGRVLYLNRAGRQVAGLSDEADVTHYTFADFYPPETLEYMATVAIPTALRDGAWSGEVMIKHFADDRQIPASLVGIVHRAPDGTPSYLSAILRDISDRKQVEHELRQAKEAAETASRAKSTFLANMSHEIRTPMNAVIGMTGLLLNTQLDARQRDFVETVRSAGDSLLTIINDILDFSKIEAQKLELEKQPFDLRAAIESVLDLLAAKAVEKGLDLIYEMDNDVPAGIVGDVTRLKQILVNLVGNAIKFTERGEVVVSVRRDDRPDQPAADPRHRLHISVKDTGIGIASNRLGSLFRSFTQLDASTTRQYGGTGLGLAISKRLAELMDGSMWAESAGRGQGSTFHFTLVVAASPVPIRHHLHQPRPELTDKRALIVDDNATNRRILSLQLQSWGLQVVEAAMPSAALEIICRDRNFDLAMLDMDMPEMDGVSLALAIREHCPIDHLPLVMLTSVGRPSVDEVEQAAAGFVAYLTKPIKSSQLYDVLVTIFAGEPSSTGDTPALSSPTLTADRLPLRILLAEDVVVNQKFALLALEEMGYQADVAANGLEVLSAVLRQPYDVILMDVQMPEMDGLEATRRIHQIWGQSSLASADPNAVRPVSLADLPTAQRPYIIAMTANALQGDREVCLEAGMDDYISKPVYLEELTAALVRAGKSRPVAQRPASQATINLIDAPVTMPMVEKAAPSPLEGQGGLNYAVLGRLLKRPGGLQIIDGYLTEAQEMLAALRQAVEAGDVVGIGQAAHRLKGSSGYVGTVKIAALSGELEWQSRQGRFEGSSELLARLEIEFEQAGQALAALISPVVEIGE